MPQLTLLSIIIVDHIGSPSTLGTVNVQILRISASSVIFLTNMDNPFPWHLSPSSLGISELRRALHFSPLQVRQASTYVKKLVIKKPFLAGANSCLFLQPFLSCMRTKDGIFVHFMRFRTWTLDINRVYCSFSYVYFMIPLNHVFVKLLELSWMKRQLEALALFSVTTLQNILMRPDMMNQLLAVKMKQSISKVSMNYTKSISLCSFYLYIELSKNREVVNMKKNG